MLATALQIAARKVSAPRFRADDGDAGWSGAAGGRHRGDRGRERTTPGRRLPGQVRHQGLRRARRARPPPPVRDPPGRPTARPPPDAGGDGMGTGRTGERRRFRLATVGPHLWVPGPLPHQVTALLDDLRRAAGRTPAVAARPTAERSATCRTRTRSRSGSGPSRARATGPPVTSAWPGTVEDKLRLGRLVSRVRIDGDSEAPEGGDMSANAPPAGSQSADPPRRSSPLLDTEEVARWLGTSVRHVQRLVTEKRLPLREGRPLHPLRLWRRGAVDRDAEGRHWSRRGRAFAVTIESRTAASADLPL